MARGCVRTAVLSALAMLALGSATGLRGQAVAAGELTVVLRMPGLFTVENEPLPAAVVRDGRYAREDGAIRLYISGNARWTLLAQTRTAAPVEMRLSSGATRVQVLGGVTESGVESGGDGGGPFIGIGSGMREVARGACGNRMPLSVDYRWQGAGGPPDVLYTVVAD